MGVFSTQRVGVRGYFQFSVLGCKGIFKSAGWVAGIFSIQQVGDVRCRSIFNSACWVGGVFSFQRVRG